MFWIAGGQAKADGIGPLEPYFSNIAKAFLIGDAAPEFRKTLKKANVDHKVSGTLELAVLCAVRDALNSNLDNPIVLLAPACASFDLFENYEDRGRQFKEAVRNL